MMIVQFFTKWGGGKAMIGKAGQIRMVALPPDSMAAHAFDQIDYADAYRVRLPHDAPHDVASVTRAFATARIGWIEALMWLRNRLVSVFGLKPEQLAPTTPTLEPSSRAGIFRVYQTAAHEVLLGEDDSHLDFRVSVLVQQQGLVCWAVISTVVRYHNLLGRLYFIPVRPFHQLIVRALARQMFAATEE